MLPDCNIKLQIGCNFMLWNAAARKKYDFSGIIILNFAFVALCGALQTHFSQRVVKIRCCLSRSAALSQKAALQLPFAVTATPVKMEYRSVRRRSGIPKL